MECMFNFSQEVRMDSRTVALELLTAEQMQTVVGGGWGIIWDFGEDRGVEPAPPPETKG